jgi:hypothetical protein
MKALWKKDKLGHLFITIAAQYRTVLVTFLKGNKVSRTLKQFELMLVSLENKFTRHVFCSV